MRPHLGGQGKPVAVVNDRRAQRDAVTRQNWRQFWRQIDRHPRAPSPEGMPGAVFGRQHRQKPRRIARPGDRLESRRTRRLGRPRANAPGQGPPPTRQAREPLDPVFRGEDHPVHPRKVEHGRQEPHPCQG